MSGQAKDHSCDFDSVAWSALEDRSSSLIVHRSPREDGVQLDWTGSPATSGEWLGGARDETHKSCSVSGQLIALTIILKSRNKEGLAS